jgi:alginate biosynthesis protein AlgX
MKLHCRLVNYGRVAAGNTVGRKPKHESTSKRQLGGLLAADIGSCASILGTQFELKLFKHLGIFQQGQLTRFVHGMASLKLMSHSMIAWCRLNSLEYYSDCGVKNTAVVSARFSALVTCLCITSSVVNAKTIPLSYGCPASVVRSEDVIIQGTDGVFFRQHPDLDMYFPLSNHIAQKLGELSDILSGRGIKLILLPVPARGTAMAMHLTDVDLSLTQGFDATQARQSYETFVNTLSTAGVATISLLPALESDATGKDFFLPADHHWNALGARTAAQTIGNYFEQNEDLKKLPHVDFATRQLGKQMLVSQMRRVIQLGCNEALPMNNVETSETKAVATKSSTTTSDNVDIFGAEEKTSSIALVGTSFSDVEAFNFAGYLSEFTKLEVSNYAVSGGNQFVSIASYLTSPGFVEAPPKVIIWENPVYNNFGEFGDAPIDELMIAASGACEADAGKALAVSETPTGIGTVAVPEGLEGNPLYLKFDAGVASVRSVKFKFNYENGSVLPQILKRSDRFKGNGRFYVKADGAGLKSISIDAIGISSTTATLTACTLATKKGS